MTLDWQLWRTEQFLPCIGGLGKGVAKEPYKIGFLYPPGHPQSLPSKEARFHQAGYVRTPLGSQIGKQVLPLESLPLTYVLKGVQVRRYGHLQRKMVDRSDYSE